MFVALDKFSDPVDSTVKTNDMYKTVHPLQKEDNSLKLGDMVTFYDNNDKPINGVARWIGRNKIVNSGSTIIGIETVSF